MKALQIVLISLLLLGCGLVSEPVTSTPRMAQVHIATLTSTPSLTPKPDIMATQIAGLAATQTAQVAKAHVARTEEFTAALTVIGKITMALDELKGTSNDFESLDINKAKLVFGPTSKTLRHNLDNTVITYDPSLSLRNFIVSIKFINPYDTSKTGSWDYGILFRNEYENDQYRLTILSNQSWSLVDARTWTNVFSRNDKHLTAIAGEENTIWLVVIDTKAYLFINGTYVQSLDVSAKLTAGDVSPATGLYYGNKTDKKTTKFYDFTVWSLP